MKRWLSTLCLSLVALTARHAFAGCSKDTDCKGDRICVAGACTAPSATPATTPASAPAAAPTPPPAAPAAVTLTEPMIAEIYMKGDVTSAINEAKAAGLTDLVGRLTAISQAYGAAYAAQQARNVDEAIRQYEFVVQYDRAVATRDNAYSSAARTALASLYAEKNRAPAATPATPYAAQPAYAPPMVAVPGATPDRTVTFSGRALEYVVEGQRCTAPCSMTLPAGVHTMEVRGLGRYRLAVNTDVTRVEARKGSPATAIIGGIALAAAPFLFWAGAVTPPDCRYNSYGSYTCDEGKKILAYVSASLFLVLGLVGLPVGIADATRTNVTVNGAQTYRASREVKFTPLLAFTGNGGFLGGQLSF